MQYKKRIIPLNGSREVHQFCLGCHEKPQKIQFNKILWLSWHTVTLAGLSFAFGITIDSIKQKDIWRFAMNVNQLNLILWKVRISGLLILWKLTWALLLSMIYHLQLYRIRLCSFLQAVKICLVVVLSLCRKGRSRQSRKLPSSC